MKATLFDYGAGNLHSLARALTHLGHEVHVDDDAARSLQDTDLWVLPGVGAFGLAAARLAPAREAVRQAIASGLPCLGICLGMQLLFDRSEEGAGLGLGLIEGDVTRLRTRRVPHIGWNAIARDPSAASEGAAPSESLGIMYFAHSYACRPVDASVVTAWATHEGDTFAASVQKGRVCGVQFHPEKSSRAGLALLGQTILRATS